MDKCEICGKYSGGATLCNLCQKKAVEESKKKNNKKPPIGKVRGTAKTLSGAIADGFEEDTSTSLRLAVHEHVRDYLSQKFTKSMLETDEKVNRILQALWAEVTGEKIK